MKKITALCLVILILLMESGFADLKYEFLQATKWGVIYTVTMDDGWRLLYNETEQTMKVDQYKGNDKEIKVPVEADHIGTYVDGLRISSGVKRVVFPEYFSVFDEYTFDDMLALPRGCEIVIMNTAADVRFVPEDCLKSKIKLAGYEGSTVHQFALTYGIPFVSIGAQKPAKAEQGGAASAVFETIQSTAGCTAGIAHEPTDDTAVYMYSLIRPCTGIHADQYHECYADVYGLTCRNCGQLYEANRYMRSAEETELVRHAFSAGICSVDGCHYRCGHFVSSDLSKYWDHTAPYAGGTQKIVTGSNRWDYDNNRHWAVGCRYSCACVNCGATIFTDVKYTDIEKENHNIVTLWEKTEEKHRISSGQCACGYTQSPGEWTKHNFVNGKCSVCDYRQKTQIYTLTWTDSVEPHTNRYDFCFDEAYFTESACNYNHDLALLSMGMVLAVQSDGALNPRVLDPLYTEFGFSTQNGSAYEAYDHGDDNDVGCAMSMRELDCNGTTYKLIAVNTRGGNYNSEWISNFDVGNGNMHRGFSAAAVKLREDFYSFCDKNGVDLKRDNVKVWVTGFSRSAAVSNYFGYLMNRDFRNAGKSISDVYVYTFATPNVVKAADTVSGYENIFNIVSPDDLVPAVPLADWGFKRYGVLISLPAYGSPESYEMLSMLRNITGGYYGGVNTFQIWKEQSKAIRAFRKLIIGVIANTDNFDEEYQESINHITSVIWNSDITNNAHARFDTIFEWGCDLGYDLLVVWTSKMLYSEIPYSGELIGYMINVSISDLDESLSQDAEFLMRFAKEFKGMPDDDKNLICELILGLNLQELKDLAWAYDGAVFGLTEEKRNAYEEMIWTYRQKFRPVGHIEATHRMETYLAWLVIGAD